MVINFYDAQAAYIGYIYSTFDRFTMCEEENKAFYFQLLVLNEYNYKILLLINMSKTSVVGPLNVNITLSTY